MSVETSRREVTGLRVCFLSDFNLPQIGYLFKPEKGVPCLSIASELRQAATLVWQLELMAQGMVNHSNFQEVRFYLERDGNISCATPLPRSTAPAA